MIDPKLANADFNIALKKAAGALDKDEWLANHQIDSEQFNSWVHDLPLTHDHAMVFCGGMQFGIELMELNREEIIDA
jgi:hypothetical protein